MVKQRKIDFAWIILIGCCALQGGTLGVVYNAAGIFFAPVCAELGFSSGDFTLYKTLMGLGACAIMPFAGKLLEKFDIRITISAACVVFAACEALMGSFTTLREWYVAGIIQGAASSFLMFTPAPIILGNWFFKKKGTAVGISSAFAGVAGVIMNPIGSSMIESLGWRSTYVAFGIIAAAVVLPFSIFVLRLHPEDIGLRPYGADNPEGGACDNVKCGRTLKQIFRSPSFYLALAVAVFINYTAGSIQHFSNFGKSLGYEPVIAAALVSSAMAGSTVGKIGLGMLGDKAGVKASHLFGTGAVAVGAALLFINNYAVLLAGTFLMGFAFAVGTVVCSQLLLMFGSREYSTAFSILSMLGMLSNSLATSVDGRIFDATGGYYPAWLICGGLSVAAFAIGIFIVRQNEREGAAIANEAQ